MRSVGQGYQMVGLHTFHQTFMRFPCALIVRTIGQGAASSADEAWALITVEPLVF